MMNETKSIFLYLFYYYILLMKHIQKCDEHNFDELIVWVSQTLMTRYHQLLCYALVITYTV